MNFSQKAVSFAALAAMTLGPGLAVVAASHAVPDAARERSETNKQKMDERRSMVDERKTDVKAEREAVRESAKEKREEARGRLTEKHKETIQRHFARMMKRFEAALERQKKLAERIQSRIDRAKANGKNTAKAQAALDKALKLWNEATASLEEVKGKIDGVVAADNPREAFKEVQSLVARTRDKIKAVHAALVDAIRALKGLGERSGERSVKPSASPEGAGTPAQ